MTEECFKNIDPIFIVYGSFSRIVGLHGAMARLVLFKLGQRWEDFFMFSYSITSLFLPAIDSLASLKKEKRRLSLSALPLICNRKIEFSGTKTRRWVYRPQPILMARSSKPRTNSLAICFLPISRAIKLAASGCHLPSS